MCSSNNLQQQRQTLQIVEGYACEANKNIGNIRRLRIFHFTIFFFSFFFLFLFFLQSSKQTLRRETIVEKFLF